ncbi:Uncharacterized protein AXF42_Ash018706 [Apostasia shenzhenica]|uniref:Uncharacterized protein n=1 Tax=Apostasia shenzhenica TaxID=1088818 RepID=A0A2H9ZZP8_9ASPA|nr:Uncharacterized protein AXF42_Ash018706 [Apostasia shenzhenica]
MSIASQLQVIKSIIRGKDDPIRRPITRPSILFGPKEAADIDLRSILPLAQSGIETLVEADDRFLSFKSTLFSHASLDIEREKMAPTEEEKLNKSICSYLRLLAGYLHLHAALRTLEYLIRRYQVHVFNIEELVLCALPYHDTHHFVRIVQLIDFGNKKWAFLDGVKASGASPPRKVIVQQCIRDKGVLEALCSYAAPSKDFQHSRPVTCFCTAVIVEALGSIPKLDTETVQRVLTFVFNGLNPAIHGSRDQKAGALMVVGLVASRATLASKLVQNLIYFIARSAQLDAKLSADLPWLRVTIMALVTLVQSQSPQIFPKKTLMIFKETRDFVGLLSGLSQEFNVQKFLHRYLESLINYSSSDDSCHRLLVDAIEALPIKEFVSKIVHKILAYCVKIMRTDGLKSFEAGNRAKQVLVVLETHYPSELHGSFRKFLENSNLEKGGEESALVIFCRMLDGNSDIAMEVSDSKVWFSLEHPKAAVRQAALLELASSDIMKCIVANPGRLVNLKDALVRRFQDDDLGVVRAALSLSGLSEIIGPRFLFKNYCVVLKRCMEMLIEGTTVQSQACDVAVFCLDHIVSDVSLHQLHNVKEVASIIFPLLLLLPKTWRVNVKALELVNKFQWPFYFNIIACSLDFVEQKLKRLDDGTSTDINLRTIQSLAEIFVANPEDHIEWLVACSRCNKLAKGLLFFLILQSLAICKEQLNMERFDKYFRQLTNQLLHTDADKLSNQILVSIFWCLFEILSGAARNRKTGDCEQVEVLNELFLLFAASSSICVFKKQLPLLLRNCCKDPFQFLSKYFLEEGFSVEVEVESLTAFANLCSIYQRDRNLGEVRSHMPLLQFPCLLVPLTSDDKEIRDAAVKCVKGIYRLWQSYDIFRLKNGNDSVLLQCASSPRFGDFLELLIGQSRLILSDVDFLSSFLSSLLSPSCDNNLLVPDDIHKRFKILALLRALGNVVLRMECCKELLVGLLGRREDYYTGIKFAHQGLSQSEIGMLCLLLEFCVPQSCSSRIDAFGEDCLLKALKVDGLTLDELAVVKPCVTVLENLKYIYDYLDSNTQDQIFINLVFLFRCENGDIRDAARDAVLNFTVSCSTIVRFIKEVIIEDPPIGSSRKSKRNKPFTSQGFGSFRNSFDRKEKIIFVLCSILDILLLKEDMDNRISLVQPLFEVLGKLFSDDWLQGVSNSSKVEGETVFEISESLSASLYHARQSTLLILKNITDSPLTDKVINVDLSTKLNFDLLVECAHSAMDAATRNHIFLLISSIAKISFGWLSEHIVDLFVLVGDSAMQLVDSYSQNVLENLISTLLPCWLAKANSVGKLFQVLTSPFLFPIYLRISVDLL